MKIPVRLAAAALAALFVSPAIVAEEHTVTAVGLEYIPAELTIQVGDTVTWVNGGGLHNVNAPGFFRCANGCDGEGGNGDPATNPWEFSRTFDTPASIDYFCDQHLAFGMIGNVTVVDGGGPSLEIGGSCPGEIDISLSGATANGAVGFALSAAEGNSVVPGGSCAGTELGLDSPTLLAVLQAGPDGTLSFSRVVNEANCGRFLQVVDTGTCTASNVAQIP